MKTFSCVFLICSFFVDAVSADAQSGKWIEFPGGLSYPLVEKHDQLSARIPVNAMSAAPLTSLQAQRRDIFSVEGRPDSLVEKITLKWEPGTKDLGPALVVSAKAEDVPPGTYTLVVQISKMDSAATDPPPVDPAPTDPPQVVTFTLQRPAPQLTSLRSVRVWQQRGFRVTTPTNGHLNLREDSGKAAIRELSFSEVRNAAKTNGPETGELTFELQETNIPAGDALTVDVVPVGDFPIGTTTGKLYVRSPQLATPVAIDYEVTSVRTPVWIGIWAILGAALGWFLRIFLQSKRDRLLALIAASEALNTLVKAKNAVPDSTFNTTVGNAVDALKAIAATGKADQITKAIEVATTALAAAESELSPRRKALSDALVPLHRLLHQSWRLPSVAEKSLAAARILVDGILLLAEAQDTRNAQARLDEDMTVACTELANAAWTWREAASKYLSAVASDPPALPDQGDARLGEAVTLWKKQFGEGRNYVIIDSAELEKEFVSTDAAYRQARAIVADLQAGGQLVSTWARDLFVPPASEAVFGEILHVAEAHADALAAEIEQPDAFRAKPAERRRKQIAVWESALLSLAPANATQSVKGALQNGQWTAAAQIAHTLVRGKTVDPDAEIGLGPEAGKLDAPNARSAAAPVSLGIPFQAMPIFGTNTTVSALRDAPEFAGTIEERRKLSGYESITAGLQTVILSIVFIALVYGFYGPEWIGTFKEMLGIFAWAFGLDITAEALSPFLKKLGSTPTT